MASPKLKPQVIRYEPLENFLNLSCMLQFDWRGRSLGAYLLRHNNDYRFTFGFECAGIHPTLTDEQLTPIFERIEAGLKDIPHGELLSIHMASFASAQERIENLETLWAKAPSSELRLILKSDQRRAEELFQSGIRKPKSLRLYATYTVSAESEQADGWLDKALAWIYDQYQQISGDQETQIIRLENLLDKGFTDGFLQWEQLLANKMGLEIRALSATELWEGIWNRLNQSSPIPVPQQIVRDESGIHEEIDSQLHPHTLLLSDVPTADRKWIHLKDKYVGVLTLVEKPAGWAGYAEQIRYMWELLARDRVYDTEIFFQLSRANDSLVKTGMMRLIKQSNNAVVAGAQQNTVDVAAKISADKAIDAQFALMEGSVPMWVGLVFLVHRNTPEELDESCRYIENCFNRPAWVTRETNYAWKLWLQTLPITWDTLLAQPFQRRLLFLHTEVLGLMPLVLPKPMDKTGLELITDEGGVPIQIDLVNQQRHLALFATTRAGKSVLVSGILTQALAAGLPVRALDFPKPDGTSTFTDYTNSLNGAYFDISREANNLFEIPDLRTLESEARKERMVDYVSFLENALITMVLGGTQDPSLSSQCRSIISLSLNLFFSDPHTMQRYDAAFVQGLGSQEWQNMPTLKDFLKFCNPDRIQLEQADGVVKQAFNIIDLRLRFWIDSRVGRSITAPSTFDTNSPLLVFALRNVDNDEDAAILALSALSSILRCALSSPASIFFIDEAPILFKFDQIAELVGTLCANGAKAGIRVILAGQDPNTIANSVAGSKIFQNLSTRLIGRIQPSAITSFEKYMEYPKEIISRNATEAFFPRKQDIYSQWLIDEGGKFTFCRYYPGMVQLATVANNPQEQSMRDEYFNQYPNRVVAMAKFADHLKAHIQAS